MATKEYYDYLQSLPFLEEFQNPFPKKPFIDEFEENYDKLWQFKNSVASWSLGVSRFKEYVYLLHREIEIGQFLRLNFDEKVTLLENFHQEYVAITLQTVDNNGEDIEHLHFVIVKIRGHVTDFSIDGLLDTF